MVTETYNKMSSNEFDALASAFIGEQYEFVSEQEADNGTCYTFDIRQEDIDEEYDEWELEQTAPIFLLTRMVKTGILPLGKYLICVNW